MYDSDKDPEYSQPSEIGITILYLIKCKFFTIIVTNYWFTYNYFYNLYYI